MSSSNNKNIGRSMTPTRLSSLLLGRGRRTNSSTDHLVDQLSSINLLDQSLTEETKQKFKERRHQSQSPNRSRRSSSTGRQEHQQYQQSMTIDMSNGRPMTPERRQPPPAFEGSAPSSTGASSHKVSFRQTAAAVQQQQKASARSAAPPPPRRMNPFLIGRRDSAKYSTSTKISSGDHIPSSVSSFSSTATGLPSRLSASPVRARSISPGWNRRRNNLPRSIDNIEIYTGTNRNNDRGQVNSGIDQGSTKGQAQLHHVSFSDTIAAAAKDKEVQKQLSVLEKKTSDQQEQIEFYEGRLKGRTQELTQLNRELADRRLKQAQLELELEVHDSKFSVYDDYRRLLDTRRLQEQTFEDDDDDGDGDGDGDDKDEGDNSILEGRNDSNIASTDRTVNGDRRKKRHGNERDLAAMLSKLERFESTMKTFEKQADKQYSELYKEYKNALSKIDILKKSSAARTEETIQELRLSKTRSSDDGVSDGGHSLLSTTISDPINDLLLCTKNSSGPTRGITTEGTATTNGESSSESMLRKRIKVLEAENARQSLNTHSLHEEIDRLKAIQNDTTSFQREEELTTLRRENTVLVNRMAALETELGYTMGHIGDKTRSRRYRALEKNMNEYTVEIMSLEDKLRAKDSVISRLKERDLSRRLGMAGVDESLALLPSSSKQDNASSVESKMKSSRRNSTTGQKVLHHVESNEDDDDGDDFDDLFAPGPDLLKSRVNKRMEDLKVHSTQTHGSTINASLSDESSSCSSTNNTNTNNNTTTIASMSGSERVAMLRKRLGELSKINEKHMKEEVST